MMKKRNITICFIGLLLLGLILTPYGLAHPSSTIPQYHSTPIPDDPTILTCVGCITNVNVNGNHWEFTTVSLWYLSIESTGNNIHLQIGHSMNDHYNLYGYLFKGITLQGIQGNTFLFGSFIKT